MITVTAVTSRVKFAMLCSLAALLNLSDGHVLSFLMRQSKGCAQVFNRNEANMELRLTGEPSD